MLNIEIVNEDSISIFRRIFRDNYELEEINKYIQDLINSGLITISEDIYVKCVNRNDNDFLDLTEDQKGCSGKSYINKDQEISECETCNRQLILESKEQFKVYTVSINYNTIIELLSEKIGNEKVSIKNNNTHIIFLDEEGKIHTLCIFDLCDSVECKSEFYYSDAILYIYCDIVLGEFKAPNIIWLFDFLSIDSEQVINFIKTKTPMVNSEKIQEVMENFIDSMSWQEFEDFITQILNYIRVNPDYYNEGMTFLQKYSGTIVSSFSIKLSGSGRTDAYSINLLNYFQLLLKSDIRIEVKHSEPSNIDSSIRLGDIRELMDHAYQNEGVIVTNRTKIDGSAIGRCIDLKEVNGRWRYVIIHRPLLKLFITLFIKEFWDNPEVFISSLNGNK